MFENLSERLQQAVNNLRGQALLTEENIQASLRQVRMALLEADVALPVVKDFIDQVSQQALGEQVIANLQPGQALIKIVQDQLVELMGAENETLNLQAQPPAVVLMAGLQGSGKTTTVGKLAKLLRERHGKKVMVASADIYRPAAIEQLQKLAEQVEVNFFPTSAESSPKQIADSALDQAQRSGMDVLILDTAGRLHVDDEMMQEIQLLHQRLNPVETLFVVDAMTGQDAAKTAAAFNESLALTGVILTKADGDARGGAALSIRHITGKPIKFIGVGEKVDDLEPFHPERMASRILGMGDMLSLVEEAERKIDHQQAEKLGRKLKKGKGFDLNDFRDQLKMVEQMGGMGSMIDKLPGMGGMAEQVKNQVNDKQLSQVDAIISSMTVKERTFPNIINGSRRKRIARGSGTQVQEVNRMLKQFIQMQKMMKKMGRKGGMKKLMRGMGQMGGGMPPGMGGLS
ncbi:MAG: signal recognition particle protein [Gammaproteobacteria bacterium]|nr:MAG: signal recognition particle protein [Gammaproteobacteria bacterium]RLA09771.1 MAG: signal recognition particle protein [Gammaproteobacteria bacterium]RLA13543.1 MAG: signal recognition particle protein [Gammaproteobacteria bacterium]